MSKTRQDNEMVPITAADMTRFHHNAWAAIKRREGTYTFDEFGNGLRSIFLGGVPIVGLLWFDWSSSELMFFLLVGTWVAIICDFAKLWHLEKQIRTWANTSYDDWHVWTIVAALRADRKMAPKSHLNARYEPWMGVMVDLVFGGLSTALILVLLAEAGEPISMRIFKDRGVMLSLAGLIVYQVVFTIWEIAAHKQGSAPDRQVKVSLGMRGLGLFLLMFLLIFVADNWGKESDATRISMLVVNGAIVLMGLVTMIGPHMIRKETVWLKDYLQKRKADGKS